MGTDLLAPVDLDGGECPASIPPEPHSWRHDGIGDSVCERCDQQVLWDPTPEYLDAYRVVGELAGTPVPAVSAADEVPDGPGLYAWYCNYRLVPDAQPRLPDPSGWNLLYVGIAPSRSTSKATPALASTRPTPGRQRRFIDVSP